MADSHALRTDTAPDTRKVQVERWRQMSSVAKARLIEALCEDARTLALAGIRERHPSASRREEILRLGAPTIERELMIAAFGWDPVREGH